MNRQVTIYVKDADRPMWEAAAKLAGSSMSAVVSAALGDYAFEAAMRIDPVLTAKVGTIEAVKQFVADGRL